MIRSGRVLEIRCGLYEVCLTDQTNRDSRDTRVGIERSKIEFGKPNSRTDSLRRSLNVRKYGRIAGILQCHLRPLLADLACCLRHELTDDREYEVVPVCIISGILIDQLTGAERIVRRITDCDGLVQQRRGIRIDNDRCPRIEVVYCLADFQYVVVELVA